jgi:hypothetical protein
LRHEAFVGFVQLAFVTQVTLALGAFLGKDMTQVTLLALEAAPACLFKALGSAAVALHFWHSELPFNFN